MAEIPIWELDSAKIRMSKILLGLLILGGILVAFWGKHAAKFWDETGLKSKGQKFSGIFSRIFLKLQNP